MKKGDIYIFLTIFLVILFIVGVVVTANKILRQNQDIRSNASENINVGNLISKPIGIILFNQSVIDPSQKELQNYLQDTLSQKGWFPLVIATKDPQQIKQAIVTTTRRFKSINYLLIIGSEQTIPIEDTDGLVMPYISGAGSNAVLDNFYYGDIDGDFFVDLAVGRIPTEDISKIRQYFSRQPTENSGDIFAISHQASFRDTVCVQQNLKFQILSDVSKKDVVNGLKNSTIFGIQAHGSQDYWEIKDGFSSSDIPLLSNHPIIIAESCETSAILGKNFIWKGASAYIGFWVLSPGYDTVIPLYRKIRLGVPIGEAIREYLNGNLADFIVRNHDDFVGADYPAFQTLSVSAEKSKIRDAAGRHAFAAGLLLYGDPSLVLNKTLSEKPILNETQRQIKLSLPANGYQLGDPDPMTGIREVTFCSSNKNDLYQSWFSSIMPNNAQGQFAELPPMAISVNKNWKAILHGTWQIDSVVPFIVPDRVSNYFSALVKGLSKSYLVLHDHLFIIEGLGKPHQVTINSQR